MHAEPEPSFLDAFGLQTAGGVAAAAGASGSADKQPASAVFAFSYLEMAACCGSTVDASTAQEWLQAVVQMIGQAMNRCKHVRLSLESEGRGR